MKNLFFAITCLLVATSCAPRMSEEDKIVAQLRQEIVHDLTENVLHFWATYAPDPSGGFYGTLNFDGAP